MDLEEIKITAKLLQNLAVGRVFKEHQKEVKSIDFSKDGKRLVSCDEEMLNVYDTLNGKKIKTLYQKTKKIDLVKFTHHNEAVICATQKDHEIQYWSLYDNEILKVFLGHRDQIISLELNPVNDVFMSTSKDMTLKLWDLNQEQQGPEAELDLTSKNCSPIAVFDPTGLIFAVSYIESINGNQITKIALYDMKQQQQGSFENWKFDFAEIKILKFSNNSNYILCGTAENQIFVIDAYQGQKITEIQGVQNENSIIECSFTSCSEFVVSGSDQGPIYIWKVRGGEEVAKLETGGHFLRSSLVKFSPTHCLLVSACKNILFWIPKTYDEI